jgi:hypothetical protein
MIRRCTNKNEQNYHNYGGRGITVCDRWLNSFEAFYEDMGSKPGLDYSIERRENDKGYYKDNCYWATREEQANNRRNNMFYEYKGSQYTIPQLTRLPEAKQIGLSVNTLTARIKQYGYSIEQAITKPVKN